MTALNFPRPPFDGMDYSFTDSQGFTTNYKWYKSKNAWYSVSTSKQKDSKKIK